MSFQTGSKETAGSSWVNRVATLDELAADLLFVGAGVGGGVGHDESGAAFRI